MRANRGLYSLFRNNILENSLCLSILFRIQNSFSDLILLNPESVTTCSCTGSDCCSPLYCATAVSSCCQFKLRSFYVVIFMMHCEHTAGIQEYSNSIMRQSKTKITAYSKNHV
ncbi:hypothetical protein AMECASPLE_013310 [Ameca splendens]|uniref:Uncharacterized protein n=1 Tax=Ameca splendens TaxID=208324 RepID=A0ABV0Z003_9TELE